MEPSGHQLWVIRRCSKDYCISNIFVDKTHPSGETHLSKALSPNLSESIVASSARLVPVFLLTKFSLVCRVDGASFWLVFLHFLFFFDFWCFMIFLVFLVFLFSLYFGIFYIFVFLYFLIFWFFDIFFWIDECGHNLLT